MDSSHRLIEVMKRRLSIINRNKYYFAPIKYARTSVLKQKDNKDNLESITNISKKHDKKYFLFQDQINLKIVPLIKRKKCAFKYENLKQAKSTEKTSSKRLFSSLIYKPLKTFSKQFSFKSPFQERKKNKNKLKVMVNLSKELHSPKIKENKLNKELLKVYSRNNNYLWYNIQKNYLDTCGNGMNIFNKIKLYKNVDKSTETRFDNYVNEENKSENILLRNIIMNKERNRRAKNYYNHIHVNKMNKIIEKYSFNSYE